MLIKQPLKRTACTKKRTCTARKSWAWRGRPSSSTQTAESRKSSPSSKRKDTLNRSWPHCDSLSLAIYSQTLMARNILFAPIACAFAVACRAQETTARWRGVATDPSGAMLPSVPVRVTNLATNTSRETKTDASGASSIPFLPAGDYSIAATLAGFQTQKVDRMTLQVQQSARVDFQLKVGDVNESVNVSASGAILQTENATVGTVIDSGKIADLPLNGRNFIQLAQLIPGVNPGTPGSITVRRGRGSVGQSDPSFGATAASANGMRDTANRYFLDGIENMDYDAVTYSFSPSIDSIAEFKVETSSYSAESGSAPGAQVNMITKSGTNQLHGTLCEFNPNTDFSPSSHALSGIRKTS